MKGNGEARFVQFVARVRYAAIPLILAGGAGLVVQEVGYLSGVGWTIVSGSMLLGGAAIGFAMSVIATIQTFDEADRMPWDKPDRDGS